jgi:hypothetical protein
MSFRAPADEQDFQRLLKALRNNDPGVTGVNLIQHWNGMVVGFGGALGRALAENTMVSSIGLYAAHLLAPSEANIGSAAPLILFLRNSASLTTVNLTMNWRSRGASLYQDLENTILNALATNTSVQTLLLYHFRWPISMPTTARLHGITNYLDSTTTLKHLWLSHFKFRGDDGNDVILAISRSPVTHLTLKYCEFDAATTDSFIQLVQGTGEQSPRARALCNLAVQKVAFDDRTVGQVLASCLDESPLKDLSWHQRDEDDVGAFFDTLATIPSQISLHTLSLTRLNARDTESMARFLPLSVSLRKLLIPCHRMDDAANRDQLLSAVRQNGSLLNVQGFGEDAIEPFLTRNDVFQNAGLRDMFVANGKEVLSYFPTFFKAAQGALRTAPNVMLIGLMAAAEDVIGPKLDKKGQLAVTNPFST